MPLRTVNINLIAPFSNATTGAILTTGTSAFRSVPGIVPSTTTNLQLNPRITSANIYSPGYFRVLGNYIDTNSNIYYGNNTVVIEFSNYNFVSTSNVQMTYTGTLTGTYDITINTPNGESVTTINAFGA